MNIPVSKFVEEIVNIPVPQIVIEMAEVSKSSTSSLRKPKCFLDELV